MPIDNTKANTQKETIVSGYDSSRSVNTTSSPGDLTTIAAVFDTIDEAERAITELRRKGFTQEEINVVSKNQRNSQQTSRYEDDITDGALTGSTLGGIGGLLIGAGALAIPGIGPIIAAGPIAGALSGALAGGIAGGLIDWGIPAEASQRYESTISQGNILAIIKTEQTKTSQASSILSQFGAKSVETHNS